MAEIEVAVQTFDEWGDGHHAQARYCVQGYDDIWWVDSLDDAVRVVRSQLDSEALGEFEE